VNAEGLRVVITGAAGGIGSALSWSFGSAGARLALLDLDRERLEPVAAKLTSAGIEALPIACDVTSWQACRRALDEVRDVDVLVNNAGITHLGHFRETDVDVIRRVMDVNFFGAVNCTRAALDSLIERRGRIVAISSVAGFGPLATRSGYSASKHALHGLFDSLRAELRGTGVSVTLVCPSFVRTEIGERALGADGGRPRMARTQTGTPLEPETIADAVFAATMRRRRLLLPSRDARLARLLSRAAPALYERIMARRIVPGSTA
jgi:short-subunit dehydrogenase